MKKTLRLPLTLLCSVGLFTGCSASSDSSDTKTPASVAESAPAGTDAPTTGTDSPTADKSAVAVDEYCKQAEDLAAKLKEVMKDPTKGDTAAVMASATKLTTDAAALVSSEPGDAARINECSQKIADAAKPGAQ